MIRAKQIGTVSQYARSFFAATSRYGSTDPASCTCTEDENDVSRSPFKKIDYSLYEKKISVTSNILTSVGSSGLKNTKTACHHHSGSCESHASLAHAQPQPSGTSGSLQPSNDRLNSRSTANTSASSNLASEEIIKAGVVAVGIFSDLVNGRLSASNGSGPSTTQMCMVDPVHKISNVKPSKVRHNRGGNRKSEAGTSPSFRCSAKSDIGQKVGTTSSVANQAKQSVSGATLGSSTNRISSDGGLFLKPRDKNNSSSPSTMKQSIGRTSEENAHALVNIGNGYLDRLSQHGTSRKGRAFSLATPSSNPVNRVDIFVNTLQQLKWGPETEVALGDLHYKLNPFQANKILKQLVDHDIALGFFNWLKCQPGFKHDPHTYTTMIGILGRAKQFGAIQRLLQEMVSNGCQPNVVTYNRVIHGYGRANYLDEAMRVFYQMQESGCEPDHVTFCTLIDIHSKAGYLDIAMDLYRKMLNAGLSPDTFTYGVMINCLGKSGHLPAAYHLFCEMIEHGCVPNLVTYNIMIALQAKARNYPCALKLYRSMQAAGFRPDKITYSIVMEVLGHCGHLEEVDMVFMEMKRDWVPDEPVYGLLVDLWGKVGKVDKARSWYQSMLYAGLKPNVPTCNSLIGAYLRVDRFSDACDVLQDMIAWGLNPSLQTYTLLLSCCTETPNYMGFCCELMAVTGHPAHAFLVSLPAAEPGGQNVRDHASAFLDLMHSEDRESKRGLLDAVIDFLHKSGFKEEAGSVWEVAAYRNLYPDALREKDTDYWLINLHMMSNGTAVTALSRMLAWFRREMLTSGVGPYRLDIITGWGRRSRVTGSSLVRQAVKDLLDLFRSPFCFENGNSGCFVGYGEPLHSWLLHPSVERMHLL